MNTDAPFAPWQDEAAAPLIEFSNVTKRFGAFTAIDKVDLKIYPKEFFALLGPSGCGKTTLMRMLGGFETVTEGRITIDGVDMNGIPPNKRAVNMMFQSYALFPNLSVFSNISYGLINNKWTKTDITDRVNGLLEMVGLQGHAHKYPSQLSGGEQQMLTIGRALMTNPDVLILDEATEGLAPLIAREIWRICSVIKESGISAIIVDKNWKHVTQITDRNVILVKGQVVFEGTSETLLNDPSVLEQHLGV